MKKLMLIVLCFPLIFSCGEKKQENKKKAKETNCNIAPDYIMSETDFLNTIEKDNENYDGKVFQFKFNLENVNFGFGGGFASCSYYKESGEDEFGDPKDLQLNFDWRNTEEEEEYYDKLRDASKKKGYTGSVLTIKGTYSNKDSELEKDDYLNPVYQFIDCCLVIPKE